MNKICALLLLSFLLFTSCDPYQFEAAHFVELKKDPCFGNCPVYKFRVDGKGNAVFEGIRNVDKQGRWERQLSPAATNQLFSAFEASNFTQFQDEYTAQVTDLPTTWLTYKNGSTEKTVKDYFGSPKALKQLEQMVETLAEQDDDWVKASEIQAE